MSTLSTTIKLYFRKGHNNLLRHDARPLDSTKHKNNSRFQGPTNTRRCVAIAQLGFTLIEVLLALAVIAIALTALLKATAQNIENTKRIKDKNTSHWIAMQAVTMIQLNLVHLDQTQEATQVTSMLGEKWYWRAKVTQTPISRIQKINISISKKDTGPFLNELTAFRYLL